MSYKSIYKVYEYCCGVRPPLVATPGICFECFFGDFNSNKISLNACFQTILTGVKNIL